MTCDHRTAVIVASRARLVSSDRCEARGSVRWCPDCGAIRAEIEGVAPFRWLHVGESVVLVAAIKAVREESEMGAHA